MPHITIEKALDALGIPLPDTASEQFQRFWEELCRWRKAVNLTACETEAEFASLFITDPLSALQVDRNINGPLVDIGTGAGNPGIPLAIAKPDMAVTLVESRQRRCAFLEHIRGVLHLALVQVVQGRAEELGRQDLHREKYATATIRAFGPVSWALECSSAFVRPNGRVLAYVGQDEIDLVQSRPNRIAKLGLRTQEDQSGPAPPFSRPPLTLHKHEALSATYPRSWKHAERAPVM